MGVFLVGLGCLFLSFCSPHIRGGVSENTPPKVETPMFSPHTWGCFGRQASSNYCIGVLPTYVGVFQRTDLKNKFVLPTYVGVFLISIDTNSIGFTVLPTYVGVFLWGCFLYIQREDVVFSPRAWG